MVASWKRTIGEAREAVIRIPMCRNISCGADVWSIGTSVLAMKVDIISIKTRKNIQTAIVASAEVATRCRKVEKSMAKPSQNAPYSVPSTMNKNNRKTSSEFGGTPIMLSPSPDISSIMLVSIMVMVVMPAKNLPLKTVSL